MISFFGVGISYFCQPSEAFSSFHQYVFLCNYSIIFFHGCMTESYFLCSFSCSGIIYFNHILTFSSLPFPVIRPFHLSEILCAVLLYWSILSVNLIFRIAFLYIFRISLIFRSLTYCNDWSSFAHLLY